MQLGNDGQNFGIVAKLFHWSAALLVFALLPIGWYMHDLPRGLEKFRYVELHKSLGLLLLLFMIGRSLWRAHNPPPPLPADLPGWEIWAAKLTHWALYGLLFLQVFAGMGLVWTANSPLTFFGWFALPNPLQPDKALHELGEELHELFAFGIVILLVMHIGAALRHHFILKNDILRRMLIVTLVIFGGVCAAVPVRAATWNVAPSSQLLFHFIQTGMSITGKFERFDTRINFDPDKPEDGRIDVTIDIASLDTQNTDRDVTLRSADLFDAEKFPQAQFTADKIRRIGEGQFEAVGTLTIRDITLPLVLPFQLMIEKQTGDGDTIAMASGSIAVSRRDYGLARGQWEAVDIVADEVKIEIRLEATQQR
jgi:cytochrome b561